MRAGKFVKQPSGYRAFIPTSLPPEPPLSMDAALGRILSNADRSLGRLDGIGTVLPNPDFFVAMYVRQEAVLSSQIEGTQSTLEDVLQFEVDGKGEGLPRDIEEVVNYIGAMNHGIKRLDTLPLSLRLIREIHEKLLQGVRGEKRDPGEFRRTQNWIGPAGANLTSAIFVPPPVPEMGEALDKFEKFLHDDSLPVLIHCGLAHAQFETIHPFLDGNGRVGRLLITLLLCQRGALHRPLLYLSHFLKANRLEYYERLMAIRNHGDWEGWMKFFLSGVAEVSEQAIEKARQIVQLREEHRDTISRSKARIANRSLRLLDYLYDQPVVSARMVEEYLNVSYVTADKVIQNLRELNLLKPMSKHRRNRRYAYDSYMALFKL